jgi:hypothetical protein
LRRQYRGMSTDLSALWDFDDPVVAWTLRLLGRSGEALAAQRVLKAELVADGVEDPYVDEEIALLEGDPTT